MTKQFIVAFCAALGIALSVSLLFKAGTSQVSVPLTAVQTPYLNSQKPAEAKPDTRYTFAVVSTMTHDGLKFYAVKCTATRAVAFDTTDAYVVVRDSSGGIAIARLP